MSGAIRIIDAAPEHLAGLLPRMRRADWFELFHACGIPPDAALWEAFAKSLRRRAALRDGQVLALWGVVPFAGYEGAGVPWFVAADGVEREARAFATHARQEVAQLMDGFTLLVNMVSAEHGAAVRFLDWCGFDVAETAEPFGPLGRPFYRFTMQAGTREDVCAE